MSDIGHNSVDGDHLTAFLERIERLEAEKKALASDIKEVFEEAKGSGFDTKIMRIVLRRRARDKDDLDEEDTMVEIYCRACGLIV
jgi:uncharacterized protein (UPF0335 family)